VCRSVGAFCALRKTEFLLSIDAFDFKVFSFVVTALMILWGVARPPIVDLTPAQCDALAAALREIGFSMPGIEVTV
jgi:hypothetical protein